MSGLVSIIMPSYNTAQYIAESIQSVINQSYTEWELIIVDDCSTDNTDEIVVPFLDDKRIRYLKNEKNSGAAVSRNRALREAKGRWIAFLDSDDLWFPNKLKKQISFMESNGYSFSYTNYEEINCDGKKNGVEVTGPKKITKTGFYNYCWPGCLTVMYDATVVGQVQIADIKKNNDYAMWLQVCKKANCYLLSEDLALYRRGRVGSISTQRISTMVKWHYRLYRDVDRQNIIKALVNTVRNMVFGFYKKRKYVNRLHKKEKTLWEKFFIRIYRTLTGNKGVWCTKGRGNRFAEGTILYEPCVVGNYNYFSPYTLAYNAKIGNFCSIGPGCRIGLAEHDVNAISTMACINNGRESMDLFDYDNPTVIGNDVWLGANVVVRQGVKISDGAVIGANAVVLHDVPPYAIAVGVPAKIVKYRFSEDKINKIVSRNWWNAKDIEKARVAVQEIKNACKENLEIRCDLLNK